MQQVIRKPTNRQGPTQPSKSKRRLFFVAWYLRGSITNPRLAVLSRPARKNSTPKPFASPTSTAALVPTRFTPRHDSESKFNMRKALLPNGFAATQKPTQISLLPPIMENPGSTLPRPTTHSRHREPLLPVRPLRASPPAWTDPAQPSFSPHELHPHKSWHDPSTESACPSGQSHPLHMGGRQRLEY